MSIVEDPKRAVFQTSRLAPTKILAILSATMLVTMVLSLSIGPTGISLMSLPRAIGAMLGWSDDLEAQRDRLVLLDIRLARTLLGAFVGAALAVAGATMQGLFRNPLADPGLIGVSAGAALAAIATIALSNSLLSPFAFALGVYALPFAAFFGGLGTTWLLVAVASRDGHLGVATLLLAGIAIGAIAGAASGFIAYASDDRELRDLTLWSMGSLSGASWIKVAAVVPFAVAIVLISPRLVNALNGLLLGEREAFHLGIDIEATKRWAIALSAAAVGAAVAAAGIVGFVGLVAPHVVRLMAGPDNRIVLPASALLGAILVVSADIAARMIFKPAELPLGLVMAVVGGPLFLHLIMRRGGGIGE